MFEFDDLEEALPAAEAYATTPMRADEFRDFGADLRRTVKNRKFQDLATAISRALWEEGTMQMRMRKIVQEYYQLLDDVCSEELPDFEAGSALTYTLWQLSLSLSMHEVLTVRQAGPVVLIMGFGGSHVDDLSHQVDWYKQQGFCVIATCPLQFPAELKAKQNASIADELRTVLKVSGRLVLHLCSHGGCMRIWDMLAKWIMGEPPFNDLPPLAKTLAAIIFECAPAQPMDGSGEIAKPPPGVLPVRAEEGEEPAAEAQEPAAEAQEPAAGQSEGKEEAKEEKIEEAAPDPWFEQMIESQVDFYRMVVMGCIGALFSRFIPNVGNLGKIMAAHKDPLTRCLRGAARFGVCGPPQWAWGQQGVPAGFHDWEGWDARLEKPVPRLFLYSERDALVQKGKVEAYCRYSKWYNPKATILQAAAKKSQHCKLWETEKTLCAEAVLNLFDHTDLKFKDARKLVGA